MVFVYILIAVVVLVVVLAAMGPSDFKVSRSATIAAPPERIFPLVNDLHKFQEWSPWAKMDPNAKVTYDGPAAGVGASFAWSGSMKVGMGRMALTESRANEAVVFRLDFEKPMKATNRAEFTFKPDGQQTLVTCSMTGKNNFMGKVFGLFVSCDKMIGGDFEKGLAAMKSIAETAARE